MKVQVKIAFWICFFITAIFIVYGLVSAIGLVKIESQWWYLFYSFSTWITTLCFFSLMCEYDNKQKTSEG